MRRIFQGYINLIETLNYDFKIKKKNIKKDYAEKLDKYIRAFDDQLSYHKEKENEMAKKIRDQERDIEYYLNKINSQDMLLVKLKKKAYLLQKEVDQYQKKNKYLEKENGEVKHKLQELIDRYGEDISEIDEQDQRKMMEQVEAEIERQKEKDGGGEDLEQIPVQEVIKEDDRGTDMGGFDTYLLMAFG